MHFSQKLCYDYFQHFLNKSNQNFEIHYEYGNYNDKGKTKTIIPLSNSLLPTRFKF